MDKRVEEATETTLRVEWRAAERDLAAAVTAEAVADRAVAAAAAADVAAAESMAVAGAAAAASARATQAAAHAMETSKLAAVTAQQATAASQAERRRARAEVAATDAAESRASERFQVAQQVRHFESKDARPRTHNELFTVDHDTAEFQTFNEFLGSTLEVTVNGQRVEAKPILGNRGFRLPSPPAKGCEIRVYYEIAGAWRDVLPDAVGPAGNGRTPHGLRDAPARP